MDRGLKDDAISWSTVAIKRHLSHSRYLVVSTSLVEQLHARLAKHLTTPIEISYDLCACANGRVEIFRDSRVDHEN